MGNYICSRCGKPVKRTDLVNADTPKDPSWICQDCNKKRKKELEEQLRRDNIIGDDVKIVVR